MKKEVMKKRGDEAEDEGASVDEAKAKAACEGLAFQSAAVARGGSSGEG